MEWSTLATLQEGDKWLRLLNTNITSVQISKASSYRTYVAGQAYLSAYHYTLLFQGIVPGIFYILPVAGLIDIYMNLRPPDMEEAYKNTTGVSKVISRRKISYYSRCSIRNALCLDITAHVRSFSDHSRLFSDLSTNHLHSCSILLPEDLAQKSASIAAENIANTVHCAGYCQSANWKWMKSIACNESEYSLLKDSFLI